MNYTKGEWKYNKVDGAIYAMNIGTSKNSPMVANTYVTDIIDQVETDVNSRLISASPDMYEALKKALALLDKQREEYNSAMSILPRKPVGEGEIANIARKALAKAEGK